jgi:hypothetical protein
MGIVKDVYIEAMEELASEAEEAGEELDESKLGEKAHAIAFDRIASMADAAKDKWKESR